MKLKMWHIYLAILIIAIAAGDGVYVYYQGHQALAIATQNRATFVHAVVAVDATRSMHDDAVAAAKEIVATRIVPSIGPGDRLLCLAIGPGYGLSSSVFGDKFEDQVPQIPEDRRAGVLSALTHLRQKPNDPLAMEDVRDLARELLPLWPGVESARRAWIERLRKLQRPQRDGTSIRALFDGIQSEFEMPARAGEERWVYLVSDLLDQPPAGVYSPSRVAGQSALNEVHIVLVYPHDSNRDWGKVRAYWREYFQNGDISILPFAKAMDDPYLLPPNPVADLERVDPRTGWDYFRPLLFPQILLICGLLVVCGFWDAFSSRGNRSSGISWSRN